MGNSPSHSAALDNGTAGQEEQLPGSVYNPFDGEASARVNFPAFPDAIQIVTGSPDSGPSIDALASMYPVDFPPR